MDVDHENLTLPQNMISTVTYSITFTFSKHIIIIASFKGKYNTYISEFYHLTILLCFIAIYAIIIIAWLDLSYLDYASIIWNPCNLLKVIRGSSKTSYKDGVITYIIMLIDERFISSNYYKHKHMDITT